MKHHQHQKIIYIVPPIKYMPLAVTINISERTRLIKQLGHSVRHVVYRGAWSVRGWLHLYRTSAKADTLIIRIDGSCVGDAYTLIKLVRPGLNIVWEVHGFPEENAPTDAPIFRHRVKKYIRWALSFFVDTNIYISEELKRYAEPRLAHRCSAVIPNFVTRHSPHFSRQTTRLSPAVQKKIRDKFVVLWGGSPQFPWQGIDTIEKLSEYIAQIDPEIQFVLVGKDSWHPLKESRNLLQIETLQRSQYRMLLKKADVCLALYTKPPQTPLYFFPMKILDYMYYKKPVIASSFPVLSSIITHNTDGFLVSNTIQDIAFYIMKLKNNPDLKRTIGEAAHKTVTDRFSEDTAKKALRDVFHAL